MSYRKKGLSQESAAAKASMSERTARRIDKGERLKKERNWRTRKDPFVLVWESELLPLLQETPDLTGLTLFEYLQEEYPGDYSVSLLRTLQRRVKYWKAENGPDKEVIFRQQVPAGWMGLSDFTSPGTLITIGGEAFPHLLYQFRLAYSGWRYVHIVLGGESYSALSEGLQHALHRAGGCPTEHRTDSLSAAFNNRCPETHKDLTQQYEQLCSHYGMTPSRNNRGISHENGAIECAHGSLKHRLDQALKLRKSTNFASVKEYQAFIDQTVSRLNRRIQSRFDEERAVLKPLPAHRFTDYMLVGVKVTKLCTIEVRRVLYSVPSRLIGERLMIHLYHDRLEGFVGEVQVLSLPRIYPIKGHERARRIDYRHVIHSLAAKPQAFRFALIRDDLLPNSTYHQFWNYVDTHLPPRDACKWIVGVLHLAAKYDAEMLLANHIETEIAQGRLPSLDNLQSLFRPHKVAPIIPLNQHTLQGYDQLLEEACHG